jgi:hypothetical protein
MKASEVRTWLGVYFLMLTLVLGGYILLLSESSLLPITKQEGVDAFEIIVPVLLGQLAVIFQWFANPPAIDKDKTIKIASWIVKGPPVGIALLLLITIVTMAVANSGEGVSWAPAGNDFKAIVTFSVSVLNATTFIVVSRYFQAVKS